MSHTAPHEDHNQSTKKPALSKSGRLGWVDYARGIAILLVVYRHTLVGLKRAGVEVLPSLYAVQEFLYNVRMPVFFLLSGVFLAGSLSRYPVKEIFRKKAGSLLYPYFLWAFILVTIQLFLNKYTNSDRTAADYWYILTQPRELDHMWYLLALFNTTLLYLLVYRLLSRFPVLHLVLAVLLHLASHYIAGYSILSDVFYHYIFLVSGSLFYTRIVNMERLTTRKLLSCFLLVLPVFILGQLYWLRTTGPDYTTGSVGQLVPYLIIIWVACFVYYLASRILHVLKAAHWLSVVGKYSLYIYILHLLVIAFVRIVFLQVFRVHEVLIILPVSLLLGIVIPVLFYRLTQKWNMYYVFSLIKPQKKS
ncbi:MAG: acyltransferase [Sphingobacteriales bacterium]|nr:acyltransferase [Sphingobacteriales bacterium]